MLIKLSLSLMLSFICHKFSNMRRSFLSAPSSQAQTHRTPFTLHFRLLPPPTVWLSWKSNLPCAPGGVPFACLFSSVASALSPAYPVGGLRAKHWQHNLMSHNDKWFILSISPPFRVTINTTDNNNGLLGTESQQYDMFREREVFVCAFLCGLCKCALKPWIHNSC